MRLHHLMLVLVLSLVAPCVAQQAPAPPSRVAPKILPSTLENWPEIERQALLDGFEDRVDSIPTKPTGEAIILRGETEVRVADSQARQFSRWTSDSRVSWIGYGLRGTKAGAIAPRGLKEISLPGMFGTYVVMRLAPGRYASPERFVLIPRNMPSRRIINRLQGGGVEQETYNEALGVTPVFKEAYGGENRGVTIVLSAPLSPGNYAVVQPHDGKIWDFDVE